MSMSYQHHYTMLNDTQKTVYESLYKKLPSCSSSIKLPLVHANEIGIAFEAVLLDNPWIFQTESYSYTKDLYKRRIILQPSYKISPRDFAQRQSLLSSSLSFIDAVKQESDYKKVLYVHDYISDTVEYDFSVSPDAHTAIGVAMNKSGVCEGIAKYVKLALDRLLIKSMVVVGRAKNPAFEQDENIDHAWNMVEVNGGWYHLDVTFDLTLRHKTNRYDYFLLQTEDMRKSHSYANNLPVTSATKIDYYSINDLAVNNVPQLGLIINKAMASGQRVIQIRLLNVNEGDDPSKKVFREIEEQCRRVFTHGYSVEMRYNDSLWVFEIEVA